MTHINSCDEAVGHEATGSLAEPSEPTASATTEEPTIEFIHQLAQHGLSQYGHHGAMTSMGLPRAKLPYFDDMQFITAQLANKPLMEEHTVGTQLVIGPAANKPLVLDIPLFVADMNFAALSNEAKSLWPELDVTWTNRTPAGLSL